MVPRVDWAAVRERINARSPEEKKADQERSALLLKEAIRTAEQLKKLGIELVCYGR